jgi:dimethylamine corrinoid protein
MTSKLSPDEYFRELSKAVVDMDEERTVSASRAALDDGVDAYEAIEKGLSHGMARAGQLFEEEEYFMPELLLCSDAMYAGLHVLKPHLKKFTDSRGKIVIGVIEGDTHDIGKNMVRIMVETGGFDVIERIGADGYAVNAAEAVKVAKELMAAA